MLEEMYGGRLLNCGKKCVTFQYVTPVASSLSGEKRRKTWYWLSQNAEYSMLHQLDFSVLIDQDGPKYTIEQVWFNGQLYNSLNDVLNFYNGNKGSLKKIKFPDVNKNLFSTMNQRGTPPIDPPLRNPVQVSPDGKRYNIEDRHVNYMFWDFDFRMSAIKGPQLYDIRFKNERIAYELSLQEIAVFYSGHNPMQAFANYLDSVGLIGFQAKGLVPGVDCPNDATFIGTTFQVESDGPIKVLNAFCLFEYNMGIPLRRHLSYSFSYGRFYEGMETTVLILRTIATLVNYDYIIDFMFYANGAIQVKVVSTGYILGTFYTADEKNYTFKLHDNLAANIHQHIFNFKADLDIKGTSNRFVTADIEIEDIENKFSKKPNARLIQHKFTTNQKSTELEAVYKYNFETPKYLLVYNEEDRHINGYRNLKCYRIINKGMSKLMLTEGSGNEPSISWARYQVAMTRFKDMEPTSSSVYANLDTEDPIVHFQNFLDDDESIVDKVSIRLID
jgi:diamine oxidase